MSQSQKIRIQLYFIIFVALFSYIVLAVTQAQTDGLVGYWSLDSNANDQSGNNNNGTVSNATLTNGHDGAANSAYDFNGTTSAITVAHNASIDDLSAFSISFWAKVRSVGENNQGYFISKEDGGNHGWVFQVYPNVNNVFFGQSFNNAGTSLYVLTANNTVSFNAWEFWTVTYDGSSNASGVHIYKNATELSRLGSRNGTGARDSDAAANLIVGNNIWAGRTFDGSLDDVRIYNRALAASEIQSLYSGSTPTPPPVCTEDWTCDDWSTCSNNTQTRTCTDANSCGTTTNRPALTQSCTVTPPPTCTENWTCSGWSACNNGTQTQTCTDSNNCGTTTNRPALSQSCTVTPPPPTSGAVYYVDFNGGSDSNSGTSTNSPWKYAPGDPNATSNAAAKNTSQNHLNPGDKVVFKKGVSYKGTINVSYSGALVLAGSNASITAGGVLTDDVANFTTAGVAAGQYVYIYHSKTSITNTWVESVGLFRISSATAHSITLADFNGIAHSTVEMTYRIINPITFTSDSNWTTGSGEAIIDGENTRQNGFSGTANHIRFDDLKFANIQDYAIRGGTDLHIVNSRFDNIANSSVNSGDYIVMQNNQVANVDYVTLNEGSMFYGLVERNKVNGGTRTIYGGRFEVIRYNNLKNLVGTVSHADAIGFIDENTTPPRAPYEYGWIYGNVIDTSVNYIAITGNGTLPSKYVVANNVFIGRVTDTRLPTPRPGDGGVSMGASNFYILNNTFIGINGGGFNWPIRLGDWSGCWGPGQSCNQNHVIENNIIYSPSSGGTIRSDTSARNNTIDYNHYFTTSDQPFGYHWSDNSSLRDSNWKKSYDEWRALGYDAHSIQNTATDPKLVDPTDFNDDTEIDVSLRSDSPDTVNGVNLSNIFTLDAAGNPRPTTGGWSLGAFQANSSGSITLPPSQCTESWSCTTWSTCTNGTQTRSCTDDNSCGTTTNKPATTQSCTVTPPSCTPNWSCTSWSACSVASAQTRVCTDLNACGVSTDKPTESQACTYTAPVVNCTPVWSCTAFVACSASGTQARTCTDTNHCNSDSGKPVESQACAYTSPVTTGGGGGGGYTPAPTTGGGAASGSGTTAPPSNPTSPLPDVGLGNVPVATAQDLDGDSLSNEAEATYGTDPQNWDTDFDSYSDGQEVNSGFDPLNPPTTLNPNLALVDRLRGYILLQVERNGEAWWVNPADGKRYYLRNGDVAYQIMRFLSLGITDADLSTIAPDTEAVRNNALTRRLKGYILLQVQQHGEAWYVNPFDSKRYYMRDGAVAYSLMRFHSLGITNADIEKIPIGTLLGKIR